MATSSDSEDGGAVAFAPATAVQLSSDDALMQKLGYKQDLHRGFSTFMSFAFCFTSVAVLSSISLSWPAMMGTGGPSVAIWAWIICAFFTVLAGASMAEICSTYPSAGSVYQ